LQNVFPDVIGIDETSYSHTHEEKIYPESGSYNCTIKCSDLGGNVDRTSLTYTVERDETPPQIVRAYKEQNKLMITTDEASECVFGINDCIYQFDDGIKMNTFDSFNHFSDWDPDKTYFIKCRDKFTNEPYPDECSFILRPTKDYSN